MEKEFIPYEQALALKELGFDEPCLAQYKKYDVGYATLDIGFSKNEIIMQFHKLSKFCSSPLYQQVFRWFREKYNITVYMYPYFKNEYQELKYLKPDGYRYITFPYGKSKVYETYEETELECLKKLIEIVKK